MQGRCMLVAIPIEASFLFVWYRWRLKVSLRLVARQSTHRPVILPPLAESSRQECWTLANSSAQAQDLLVESITKIGRVRDINVGVPRSGSSG